MVPNGHVAVCVAGSCSAQHSRGSQLTREPFVVVAGLATLIVFRGEGVRVQDPSGCTVEDEWRDDTRLSIPMWDSTLQTFVALLHGLAQLCEPGRERLQAEIRSYLLQTTDSRADLDIVCEGVAEALEKVRRDARSPRRSLT